MKVINDTKLFTEQEIIPAARLLAAGKLVAFPTETVYGLGADALNSKAVKNIFQAKGRPADNPLIVHISKLTMIENLIAGQLSSTVKQLINNFWPGPLTIILPKSEQVPPVTTGGLSTVAVRMPAHSVAQKLITQSDVPVAAPSANLSGRPSPTLAQHVLDDLAGRISAVVDGGQTGIGIESTVLDCSQEVPTLLRPGEVTGEDLQAVLGKIKVDSSVAAEVTTDKPRAPGMKYRHYSPQTEVVVVEGTSEQIVPQIKELVASNQGRVGVMATTENIDCYHNCLVKDMGSRRNVREISNNIFKLLRELDQESLDKIIVEGIPATGLGLAVMNRLRKAANYISRT